MPQQREIVAHHGSPANNALQLLAYPAPAPGLAPRNYEVRYPPAGANGAAQAILQVRFPSGPQIGDFEVTNELLLAIVQDRLQQFQGGQFKCDENGMALAAVSTALMWLMERTSARQARGVEGTQVP